MEGAASGGAVVVEGLGKKFRPRPPEDASLLAAVESVFAARTEPRELWALKDVSFALRGGDSVGILGRNGAGKSVLLSLIAGILRPTEGRVRVVGRAQPLFQMTQGLHSRLSVEANARLCAVLLGLDEAAAQERLESILEFAGLRGRRGDCVGELSSGLAARIPFAASLHADIDVFLIDEMFLVGDAGFRQQCLEAMERLRDDGKTFLLAAHDAALVERFCRRCLVLEGGRLVAQGPSRPTVRGYLEGLGASRPGGASDVAGRRAVANYSEARRLLPGRLAAAGFSVVQAEEASEEEILRAHSRDWLARLKANDLTAEEEEAWALPFSREILPLAGRECGGTLWACRRALSGGLGVHLGGGLHHAVATHGRGYCAVNDIAVALRMLMAEGRVLRPLIIDLDAHQGDGTARLFAAEPAVYTFSMHNARAYPFPKAIGCLDVELEPGTGDEDYLDLLGRHLGRVFDEHSPDFVLYVAGADPFERDPLGGLGLSLQGLARRDRTVFQAAAARGAAIGVVAGGGYGPVEDLLAIRLATVAAAWESRPCAERLVAA